MALKDLNFNLLFRLARIKEVEEAHINKDPILKEIYPYVMKIKYGSFTQSDFDECIKKNRADILMYLDPSSNLFNYNNILKCVEMNGSLLGYVPENKQNELIRLTACKQNGHALKFVYSSIINDRIVIAALEQTSKAKEDLLEFYNEATKKSWQLN